MEQMITCLVQSEVIGSAVSAENFRFTSLNKLSKRDVTKFLIYEMCDE